MSLAEVRARLRTSPVAPAAPFPLWMRDTLSGVGIGLCIALVWLG